MVLYYLLLSLVLSFLLPLFLLFRKHRSYSTASNVPPGRMGWPVIGESLAFQSAIREGHPEKFFFDRAEPDRAAFKTSLLCEPVVVLCGAAGNKFIFSNDERHVTSWMPPGLEKLFYASVKKDSKSQIKKVRKVLPGILKIEALRHSIGVMDEVARRHFTAEWGGGGEVFVARLAKRYTFRVSMSILANLEDPEEIRTLEESFATLEAGAFSIPVNLPGTTLNLALKAMKVMMNEVVKVIRQRKTELEEGKAGTAHDLLSQMLVTRTDDGEEYSEIDIASCIISLIYAIHGTTSSACTSLVKYLTKIPRIYEGVRNEQMKIANLKAEGEMLNWDDLKSMTYSWNVAREVLRLAPPAPGNFREAISNFTFAGFSVPKGWKVYWSASATHMNPAYFPDPEKFDPARFEGSGPIPHTFVPFGGGPRMCAGKEYARVKILVFMHNLVKYCPWENTVLD